MADRLKIQRKTGFTVLPNAVLRDERLNLQTKGLFCLMLSLPDSWDFSVGGLAKLAGCSREKIRNALVGLEQTGYLLREQSHGDNGKFGGNTYVLYDEAQAPLPGFPPTGKPSTGKPSAGNSPQLNKDTVNKDKKTPIVPTEVLAAVEEYAAGDRILADALMGLLENRAAIKKPVKTLRAMAGILRDLDKHSKGCRTTKLILLEKAITSNWLTVYPLKQDEPPRETGGTVQQKEGDYEV